MQEALYNKTSHQRVPVCEPGSALLTIIVLFSLLFPAPSSAGETEKIEDILSRANSAVENKAWDLGLRYYKAAQKLQPDNPVHIFNVALTLDHMDWHQLDAIIWYRAYLAAAPDAENSEKVLQRIIELERGALGNAKFLVRQAEAVVSGLPDNERDVGRANIALAQALVGDWDGAVATARKAEGDPQSAYSKDGILRDIVVQYAKHDDDEHVTKTLSLLSDREKLNETLSQLVTVYTSKDRAQNAWAMASKITDWNRRAEAFAKVAGTMARADDRTGSDAAVDEAVKAAANVTDYSRNSLRDDVYMKIAAGYSSAGILSVDKFIANISDPEKNKQTRLEVAKNLVERGDYVSARRLVSDLTKEDGNVKWVNDFNNRMASRAYTAEQKGDRAQVLLIAQSMFDNQKKAGIYTDLALKSQKEGDRKKALEMLRKADQLFRLEQSRGVAFDKSALREVINANLLLAESSADNEQIVITELVNESLWLYRQHTDPAGDIYLNTHKIVGQLIRLGRIEDALAFLPNIVTLPDYSKKEIVKPIADRLVTTGKYPMALQVMEKYAATEKDPVLSAIAHRLIGEGRMEDALDYILKMNEGSERHGALKELVEFYMADEEYSKARKVIEKHAHADKRDSLYAFLSSATAAVWNEQETERAIESIATTDERFKAYVSAGNRFFTAGRLGSARKFAHKAVDLAGGQATDLSLAVLLLKLGEIDEDRLIRRPDDSASSYLMDKRLDRGEINGVMEVLRSIKNPQNKIVPLLSVAQKLGLPGDGDIYFRQAYDLARALNIKAYGLGYYYDRRFLQYYDCQDFINARTALFGLEPIQKISREELAEKFAYYRNSSASSIYSKSTYATNKAGEFLKLYLGPSAALALAEGNAYAAGITGSSSEEYITNIMAEWRELGYAGEVLMSLGELDEPFVMGIEAAKVLMTLGDKQEAGRWLEAAAGSLQTGSRQYNSQMKKLLLAYAETGNVNAALRILSEADFSKESSTDIASIARTMQQNGKNEASHYLWEQAALRNNSVNTLPKDMAKAGELELAIAVQEKMLALPDAPFYSYFNYYAALNYLAIAEAQLSSGQTSTALSTISRIPDLLERDIYKGRINYDVIADYFALSARAGDTATARTFLTRPGMYLGRNYYKIAAELFLAGDRIEAGKSAQELYDRLSELFPQVFSVDQELALAVATVQMGRGAFDQAIVTMQPHEKEKIYSPFLWLLVDRLREEGNVSRAALVLLDTDDQVLTAIKAYPLIPDLIRQGRRDLALQLSRKISTPYLRDMALVRTMLAKYYWEGSHALAIAGEISAESRAFGLLSLARLAIRRDDMVSARAALLSAMVPALHAPSATARLYLLSSIAGLQSQAGDPLAPFSLTKALHLENDGNPDWDLLSNVWFKGWPVVHSERLEAEKAKTSQAAKEVRNWISLSDSLDRGDYDQGPTLYTDIPVFLEWVRQRAASKNSAFEGLYKITNGAGRIVGRIQEIRGKAKEWN